MGSFNETSYSMVIKLDAVLDNNKWWPAVKLSDSPEKKYWRSRGNKGYTGIY